MPVLCRKVSGILHSESIWKQPLATVRQKIYIMFSLAGTENFLILTDANAWQKYSKIVCFPG